MPKIIIWGYPIHSHTHSYIHFGWFKAFKHLGYETYWFSDNDYPNDFNFENAIFITEGYADKNIPLVNTSVYFVHICINPKKYIGMVKRLIEIRFLVDQIKDYNYDYILNREICTKISECTYYQKLSNNGDLRKYKQNPENIDYECIYTCWATDLLPHEIQEKDILQKRENTIFWCGSYNQINNKELNKFMTECQKNNISIIYNDPWKNPKSMEEVKILTQKSYMAPDIRSSGDYNKIKLGESGTCHKYIGYIPCRIFKSISYGQLGITNSKHVYELMEKIVIYNDDETQLFYDSEKHIKDVDLIKKQMELVKKKHTYINRINDLFKVINIIN